MREDDYNFDLNFSSTDLLIAFVGGCVITYFVFMVW